MEDLPQPTGQDVIHEAVGAIIEFWGFKRVMGRIWALLYLSQTPLSAAEICEQLQISAGSASMTLNDLQSWGVVKRAVAPTTRAAVYKAETNVWKMVSRVFRERERDRVLNLATQLREGSKKLREQATAEKSLEKAEALGVQAEKSDHLAMLAEQAVAMLEALLDTAHIDLGPLVEALRRP